MKNIAVSTCLWAVLVTSPAYAAEKPIRLNCKGNLTSTVIIFAADKLQEKKDAATVDIALDLEHKAMKIDGWWGCVPSGKEDLEMCGPALPVTISESEIRYFAHSTHVTTELTINRFSGRMAVSSVYQPTSGAKWDSQSVAGDLSCTQITKALF